MDDMEPNPKRRKISKTDSEEDCLPSHRSVVHHQGTLNVQGQRAALLHGKAHFVDANFNDQIDELANRFQLWDFNPKLKNFPLPPEVRNHIYRYLLHADHCSIPASARDTRGKQYYRFHTAILLINREIYHESKAVLYGSNDFVTIHIELPIQGPAGVQIAMPDAMGLPTVLRTCIDGPDVSMTVRFGRSNELSGTSPSSSTTVLIAARDLPCWCKFLQCCMLPQLNNQWMVVSSSHVSPHLIGSYANFDEQLDIKLLVPAYKKSIAHVRHHILEPLRNLGGAQGHISISAYRDVEYVNKVQQSMTPKLLWVDAIGWSVMDLVATSKSNMNLAAFQGDISTSFQTFRGIYKVLQFFDLATSHWVVRRDTMQADWRYAMKLTTLDLGLFALSAVLNLGAPRTERVVAEEFLARCVSHLPWPNQVVPPPHNDPFGLSSFDCLEALREGHEKAVDLFLAWTYHITGLWKAERGRPLEAILCLQAALRRDPCNAGIQGDLAKARADFECVSKNGINRPCHDQHPTLNRETSSLAGRVIISNLFRLVKRPEGMRGVRDYNHELSDNTLKTMGIGRDELDG